LHGPPGHSKKICSVIVIGKNKIQSSMLKNFFIAEVGLTCTQETIHLLDSVDDSQLLLIDCSSYSVALIEHFLIKISEKKERGVSVALFNATRDKEVESLARWPHIKGIFYDVDSSENLLQGVKEILNSGLWLPRHLTHSLLDYYRKPLCHKGMIKDASLTRRETQVIKCLEQGQSNDEIAETLHLSGHTVKTHLYKAFKKIGVSNRLQASHWAKEHLD